MDTIGIRSIDEYYAGKQVTACVRTTKAYTLAELGLFTCSNTRRHSEPALLTSHVGRTEVLYYKIKALNTTVVARIPNEMSPRLVKRTVMHHGNETSTVSVSVYEAQR